MSLIRYKNGFRLYEKPFSTAGFTGNEFHVPCYEVQADLTTKALLREAFLGRRQKTPLLAPPSCGPTCWEGYRALQVSPHGAQRSCWCRSATIHPKMRDQRPFPDGALCKHSPTWLIPPGLEVLQAAVFAWGKRNLLKGRGR